MTNQETAHNIAIFVLGPVLNEAWSLMKNISLQEWRWYKGEDFDYTMADLPIGENCTLYFFNPPENRGFFYSDIEVIRSELNISSIGFIVMIDLSNPQNFRRVQSLWYGTKAYWDSVIVLADRRNRFGKSKQDQYIEEMYQHVLGDRWSAQIYPCDVKQQRYKVLEVLLHLLDLMPNQPDIQAIQKKIQNEIAVGIQDQTVQILVIEPFYPSEAGIQLAEDKEQPFLLPECIEIDTDVIKFHKAPRDKWHNADWMDKFRFQYPNALMGCIVLLNPLLSRASPKITDFISISDHLSQYPCVYIGYSEEGYSIDRQTERLMRLSQGSDAVVIVGDIRKPDDVKRAVKRLMDAFPNDELASYIKAKLG